MLPTRCINVESNRFFLRLLWALPPSPSVLNHWTNSPRHFLTWSIFLITLRGEGGGGGGGVHTWRYALGWLLAIRWYYLQNWNEIFSVFSCWYLFFLWLWLAPPHMLPAWCSFWKLNATFISIFRTIPYQKFSSNRETIFQYHWNTCNSNEWSLAKCNGFGMSYWFHNAIMNMKGKENLKQINYELEGKKN